MGAGIRQPQRPHTKKFLQVKQFVFIDVFVRLPPTTIKIIYEGGMQSLSRMSLQNQLAKFWVGAKFCPKKRTKNQKMSGGGRGQKKSIF